MHTYSALAHRNLEICSPVPWHVYETLLRGSEIPAQPEILDIGCGRAGILARVLELTDGSGIGIDLPNSLASDITVRAEELRAAGKLEIFLEDAQTFLLKTDQRFDLIICVGSSHALGGPQQVFEWASKLLEPGGKLLFGEIVWKSPPPKEFLDFLECSEQDQMYSAQLIELAQKYRLVIQRSTSCSDSDFDAYESELKRAIDTWAMSNAIHPKAAEFSKRSEIWSEAREKWARNTFGFEVMIAAQT